MSLFKHIHILGWIDGKIDNFINPKKGNMVLL